MLLKFVKDTIFIFINRFFALYLIITIFSFPFAASAAELVDYNYQVGGETIVNIVSATWDLGIRYVPADNIDLSLIRVPAYTPYNGSGDITLYICDYQCSLGGQIAEATTIPPKSNDTGLVTDTNDVRWANFNFSGVELLSGTTYYFILVPNFTQDIYYHNGSINHPKLARNSVTNFSTTASYGSYQQTDIVIEIYDLGDPFSDFSILGASTSPSEVFSTVANGVRDTGEPLWPLFTFVGVPAAFGIGRSLIGLIKSSV